MATASKGVATLHPDYEKFAPKWKRSRDVSDGQDAVHAGRAAYLPRLKDQTEEDYLAYVGRAGFYNATWRTLSGLVGMMFRKPPKMKVSAGIEEYLKDVDLAGTSLDTFAKTIALEILEVGRVGLLVDHPTVENVSALTIAAAQAQGLRPSIQTYRAESIINWKYRRIRNRFVLAMVVLKECVPEKDGEFAEKQVDQYRVLDLDLADEYRVRLFRRVNEKDEQQGVDAYPLMDGKPLDYIPFGMAGIDGIDSDMDEPPMIDLVDLNLSHYRTNADYEHGCHFTGLPTPYIAGYQAESEGEKFYIGSQAAWVFRDPSAKVGFLEFTGQGLSSLKENLDRKEQQMAMLGARMLAPEKKQAETATTAAIHRTGENSILSSTALAVSETLEWALGIFSAWAGQDVAVEYQLNRDFNPAMIDGRELIALVTATQAGFISHQELFDLLQRADVIDGELTFDEHQAQVDIQNGPIAPTMVAPAADPNAPPTKAVA
jgi:hypothetical protein